MERIKLTDGTDITVKVLLRSESVVLVRDSNYYYLVNKAEIETIEPLKGKCMHSLDITNKEDIQYNEELAK